MGLPLPLRSLAALGAALWLAACTQASGPVFYLLETPAPVPAAERPAAGAEIGLREIALPLYARRPQIPVLEPDGSVTLSDGHRWAEEPARATTRLVARAISAELGRPVLVEPWPPEVRPGIRVDVDVGYLIGSFGSTLRLEGQYRAIAADRPEVPATAPFEIIEPVAGPDYADLITAQRRALTALGTAIAADLRRLER